jgi:glycosyltransferase involved in cell wall biosynthesis
MSPKKMKVLFVTSSLNLGGAERQLLLLSQKLKIEGEVQIVSLAADGPLREKYLQHFPNSLFLVDKNTLYQILQLMRIMTSYRPDVVITWLYKADLLGGVAAKLAGNYPVLWSARNSAIPNFSITKKLALSFFSKFIPRKIIANGSPAYNYHRSIGYPEKKLLVIPNFLNPWTLDLKSNSRLIQEVESIERLRVGIAARQVSGKGILESIRALNDNISQLPPIDLTIIGQSTVESSIWQEQGAYLGHHVSEVVSDKELADWFQGLDLYLMASTAWESQPNSLLEAAAIGCPVLVSKNIELDIQVPPNLLFDPLDPSSLVNGIQLLMSQSVSRRRMDVESLNNHINAKFGLEKNLKKWSEVIVANQRGDSIWE